MKLIMENWRGYLNEIAIGQCYPHAVKMAQTTTKDEFSDLSKFKVVHGRVTDKFSGESHLHAWVEKGGLVFDWQTSRGERPDGIPKADYYDIFTPEIHDEYTAEETMQNCLKSGKVGPWEELDEDFQGDVKRTHPQNKHKLISRGGNPKKEGPFNVDPNPKRGKSAPPAAL